jgi:hypothetical protein
MATATASEPVQAAAIERKRSSVGVSESEAKWRRQIEIDEQKRIVDDQLIRDAQLALERDKR